MRTYHFFTMPKRRLTSLLLAAIIIACSLPCAQLFAKNDSDSLKLIVVTGGPTLRHHINLVPSSFYTLFEGYDNIQWDHASSDEAAFQSEELANYDVLVMYNRSDSLSATSMENLKSFLESGKGVVILHHALGSYNDWEWWWRDVVAGKYQMKDTDDFPKSTYKLGERISVSAVEKHPITVEMEAFEFQDETYKKLWISPEAQILYKTDNPTSDGPVAWISPYANSRVIVLQPGHTNVAHKNKYYRALVHRAIIWSSGNSE